MRTFALTLICTVFANHLVSAQELASAPYADLKKLIIAAVADVPAVVASEARLRVRTTNPHASPGELRIWLDADGGQTDLKVEEDGSVMLPRLEDNLAASAWVRSNQPRGTLVFTVIYELKLKPRGKRVENALVIPYNDLFAANAVIDTAEGELTNAKLGLESRMTSHSINAIVFSLDESDQPSRVAIKTKKSTVDIRRSDENHYRIPFEQSLVSEPSVVIVIPHAGWTLKAELGPSTTTENKSEPSIAPKSR